jgi:hypothetical protein
MSGLSRPHRRDAGTGMTGHKTSAAAVFPSVRFVSAPRPTGCVLVDAEEDFDWRRPVHGVPHSVRGMQHLGDLQHILAAYGAVPIYLVTYPVLQDDTVVAGLRLGLERGQCEIGIQLHTWVTPPFPETASLRNSFGGNLDSGLEERKLVALMGLFRQHFGRDPVVFKAGRYGLGRNTPTLLEKHGFLVDTSPGAADIVRRGIGARFQRRRLSHILVRRQPQAA